MGTFNDISATFEIDAKGSLKIVENADAIRQSIKNILLTSTGSRPGTKQDDFGTNLRKFAFAPLTQFSGQRLANEVLRNLEKYESRIEIEKVRVDVDNDEKRFDFAVYYSVKSAKGQIEEFRMVVNQM